MQLPQYKKKKRIKLKICRFPGCAIEYWGHPISKYCKTHQDIKLRAKHKKDVAAQEPVGSIEDLDENNQYIDRMEEYKETVEMEFVCALKGCENKFRVKIFPKQRIYPKYCADHRTPFRRGVFLDLRKKNAKKETRSV